MKKLICLLAALAFVSCGKKTSTDYDKNEYSLDGVKLIAESISETQNPDTFLQEKYELSPTRRLLLRYEKFKDHTNRVALGKNNKVQLQIRVLGNVAMGKTLRLCPLTRDWMMLSTWQNAHPFNNDGRWRKAGGDYDEEGCVAPVADATRNGAIHFDITRWFIDFPKGRSVNYGLILMTSAEVTVSGEKSGSFSPRILYDSEPPTTTWRN